MSNQESELARAEAQRRDLSRRAKQTEGSLTEAEDRMNHMDEYVARLKAEVNMLRRQRAVLEVELEGSVHQSTRAMHQQQGLSLSCPPPSPPSCASEYPLLSPT